MIIGLRETDSGYSAGPERPSRLDEYSQDSINGIVHKYAEPTFHCSVHTSGTPPPVIFTQSSVCPAATAFRYARSAGARRRRLSGHTPSTSAVPDPKVRNP